MIPEGWKRIKLEEVTFFKSGKTRPATEGSFPIYGGNGILGYANEYNSENEVIIIGRVGAYCGSVFYEDRPLWVSDNALMALPRNGNKTKFLYYLLKLHDLNRFAQGSSHPLLTQTILNDILVAVPENFIEQSRIASILSSLDDKIELNLKMNKTLEAIAQAIFKEWFMDFRFPGFDGELVDGLPEGWRNGTILEIADLLSGGTPRTEIQEYWNGEIKWISAKDITANNGGFILSTEKRITETGLYKSAAKLLPKYTTVVSARGTVGNYCMIPEEMAISQSNYGLKTKKDNCDFFLFLMIENMIEKMKAYSYGTVFDTITTKTFKEIEIIIPSMNKIDELNNLLKPIYGRILCNSYQHQTLIQLRDSLLPNLMTGKIRV